MNDLTLGSLFDGIGGFPLAAQRYGIKALWASEIEPNCIAITKRHFPDMVHLGSLTKIDGGKIPPVDIISFGSPCQDLSVAGAQKGMKLICPECGQGFNIDDGISTCPYCGADIEKTRSGLFVEAVRIIYEMRCATNGKYPTFIIWENVPGAFTSNGGGDFRRVLEEITKRRISMPVRGKWAKAGMVRTCGVEVAWRQLDAQYWGVPQRRKRIFLVADFGGQRATEILFKCESLLGYSQQGKAEGKRIAVDSESCVGTSSGNQHCVISTHPINDAVIHGAANGLGIGGDNDPAPTLTGRDRHGIAFYEALPQEYIGTEETVVCFGRSGDRIRLNSQKSATLVATDGGGGAATGIYMLPTEQNESKFFEAYQHCGYRESEIAGTMTAGQQSGRGDMPIVCEQHAFENHQHGGYKEGCGTLRASSGDYGGGSENLVVQIKKVCFWVRYILRKLTPLECERLQGYPDEWTRYGYNGEEIKDTPRYVAIGNSLAVPCAERVFCGIVAVLSR